ncbi:glycoside hydrolase family 140 protein [Pedobacter alpinus]|uniref:Glycoside hydrolase family 140 protein n=1 Tax=Pedobacter alpinus TaxID=1590643 RepID=A0ABW5TQU6_9SPHI
MKKSFLIILFLAVSNFLAAQIKPWKNGNLRVSSNGHYIQTGDGHPFFWQGDTAWLLFQRLNRDEVKQYFENRKAKGFNVVQCIFYQSYNDSNAYGDSAYVDKDLTKPKHTPGNDPNDKDQYDFWDHADYIADVAEQNGIYLAIAPTWGQLVLRDKQMTKEKAKLFATHLANHFKDKPNIIWVNGGSAKPEVNTDIWETIGSTIKENDPNHLITFHPFGRMQSSTIFNDAKWLDVNMFTSGHRNYSQDNTSRKVGEDSWMYVLEDFAKSPVKPTIDGEPSYESLPQGLHDQTQPYWNAADVRRYAYWSVFAGACGHVYGQNSVRQVYKEGVNKPESGAKITFVKALDDEGAFQMQYVKNLMLSRPYFDRVNDQSLVLDNGEKYDRVLATRGKDYLMAYVYNGRDFTLKMGGISGSKVKAWWFNPKTGKAQVAGTYPNKGTVSFNPPNEKLDGNDWVLVLDDASKKFTAPGLVNK